MEDKNDRFEAEEFTPRDEASGQKGSSSRGLWAAVIVLLCATAISLAVVMREKSHESEMASRNAELGSTLSQSQTEVSTLASKVNTFEAAQAAAAAKAQQEAAAKKTAARTGAVRHTRAHRPSLAEQRMNKLQSELDENQKAISSTQQDLAQTRQDLQSNLDSAQNQLGGQIAKTHGELVELEQKGERNYYEFDLSKLKQFKREGPVSLKLHKANTKHQYCDLELIVNDRDVTKKHVNIYEPVVFYPEGGQQPVELVINAIGKDHMHGYVSEPKYGQARTSASDKAAAPAPATNASVGTPAPAQASTTADTPHVDQKSPEKQ
jgi:DNA polymerase III gamma/tau subunit